jgi:hypothetical protein
MDWIVTLNAVASGFAGVAAGASYVGAVVAPNAQFDELDYSRADKQTREVLRRTSPVAAIACALAAVLAALGQAPGGAVICAISAFGFALNMWTLSPKKERPLPPGVRNRHKTRRIAAVYLTLMFCMTTITAAVLCGLGI